jgi:hypothetical protein
LSYLSAGITEVLDPKSCTPIFISALFTIAKLWKQPRWPTTDEWIKKMWYLYTMEFYAAMKKNEILSSRPRRPKIICSPSYADIRSRVNTTRGLDNDHMIT